MRSDVVDPLARVSFASLAGGASIPLLAGALRAGAPEAVEGAARTCRRRRAAAEGPRDRRGPAARDRLTGRRVRAAAVFVVGLGFWLLLSDHRTGLGLVLAVGSAALVALANRELEMVSAALRVAPRFLLYLPWLFQQIVIANLQVVRLVLDPRLPIDPTVVRVEAPLASDLALTALGNSITLTPGTVTLDVEGRTLVVHAVTREGADALLDGTMARRIARAFREEGP
jgi:multicomponent Na+:H+ antiporter subunit E